MGRTSEYAAWCEEVLREQYEVDDHIEFDWDSFEGVPVPGPFSWFRSRLEDDAALARLETEGASWDVFISFASRIRDDFARPAATALEDAGLSVWYDEQTIGPGHPDTYINAGIPRVSVGLIIVSEQYLGRKWTTYELEGLLYAGVSELFIVAHRLDPHVQEIAETLAADLESSCPTSFMTLQSNRTTALATRVRAAVRRSRPPRQPHGSRGREAVAKAKRAHRRYLNALEEREHRAYQDSILAMLPKYHDDEALELLFDELPEEARERYYRLPDPRDEFA